ncbi:hypothetical protein BGW36DRAFT_369104 [Talaromyces proteolyticus]|uniref:C2H2-type domain-containing protein n=1 Tax=Talaromyces proteolyticus TaxID=1131652 RepID=A0AAD4PZR6_9EURO|nr:uncharacterized protein BGW36DRAFT_369104 [Talaromyces proteolyticus]KAH8703293.1 hypothetical protein BGW36DRAFT_369104 [Talaromyces proteolyticus]
MTATSADEYPLYEQSEVDLASDSHEDDAVSNKGRVRRRGQTTGSRRRSATRDTSQSPPPYRPNRWTGSDERWRHLTLPERKLIEQLDELENRDWSLGLYKAHLIKERRKIRLENDQEFRTKNRQADWTAWPLDPEEVARLDSHIEYTLRKRRDSSSSSHQPQTDLKRTAYIDLNGRRRNAAPDPNYSESLSDEDSISDPPSIADSTEIIASYKPHVFKAETDFRESASLEEAVIAQMMKAAKERFWKRQSAPDFQSAGYTVSADDEMVAMQLQPIARNILAQFDDLLFGMHQRADKGHPSRRKGSVFSSPRRSVTGDDTNNDSDGESGDQYRGRSGRRSVSISARGKGRSKSKAASSQWGPSSVSHSRVGDRYATVSPSRKRVANRTWESVMLVASLLDWPEEVLDRANERVQELFGKTAPLAPRRRDLKVQYLGRGLVLPVPANPRHIEPLIHRSDLDKHKPLIHSGENAMTSVDQSRSLSRSRSAIGVDIPATEDQDESADLKRGPKEDVDKHPVCPVAKCSRHTVPFSRPWNLKEHMKRKHPKVNLSLPQPRQGEIKAPKWKSEETVLSSDDQAEYEVAEEEEVKPKFFCPVETCSRHRKGFTRKWNRQKHIKKLHPEFWSKQVDSE